MFSCRMEIVQPRYGRAVCSGSYKGNYSVRDVLQSTSTKVSAYSLILWQRVEKFVLSRCARCSMAEAFILSIFFVSIVVSSTLLWVFCFHYGYGCLRG